MKRRIVSVSNDTTRNYRVAIDLCPHCNSKFTYQQWERAAHTLILEPRIIKNGHVAVMAECLKCFENSWHHYRMSEFTWNHEGWPKSWRETVLKLRAAQVANALNDWQRSLCSNCHNLEKAEINTHAWRNCTVGSGPALQACTSFLQITEAKTA